MRPAATWACSERRAAHRHGFNCVENAHASPRVILSMGCGGDREGGPGGNDGNPRSQDRDLGHPLSWEVELWIWGDGASPVALC